MEAEFDRKAIRYTFLKGSIACVASIVGILNTDAFRKTVNEARREEPSESEGGDSETLREIRDALLRIESRLP